MAQKNEEVIVLDVADSQTISAGDPIKVVSGYATKNSSNLSADTMGIALTDATFTTVVAEGVRKKLGVLTTGKFDFTGLVENDNTGTYTTDISPGDPVSIYWSGSSPYVVNTTTNPIGTAQASLTGNEDTTVEKEGVGTIAASGLSLDNLPVTATIHIEVPGKVFTITEDVGSAAAGVCDVTLATGALIFNASDVTDYSGQQVYAKYDYDANTDTTGSIEVRLSFLPKESVISSEIAPGAVGPTDIDSTASYTMANLTATNNLSAGGNIYGNITDTTFGDLTIASALFTGAGTAVTVNNNLSVGGDISGNITDTTFGDLTIASADFTGAGFGVEVTNNASIGGTLIAGNSTLSDITSGNIDAGANNVSCTNLVATGTITGEVQDTTFGDITVASMNATGAGEAVLVNNNISAGGIVAATGNISSASAMMGIDTGTSNAGTVVLVDSNGSDYYKIQVLSGALTATKI